MKLDYDCLRQILLTIEEDLVWEDDLNYCRLNLKHMVQKLSKFSKADIAYTSKIAIEANLIEGYLNDCDCGILDISYFGLTYEGHQFIDTVRENKIWKKTKEILSSVGGASLSVITSIANDCLTNFISNRLS